MVKHILIGTILLLSAGAFAQPTAAQVTKQKPIYEQETFSIVPGTLRAMFETADAIVDVNVLSSNVKGIGANPKVRTFYTAKVLRVLKGNVGEKNRITFSHAAGNLELSDRILRAAADPLSVGQRYIVFLYRDQPQFGGWTVLGEREGVFKIRDGRIEPEGRGHAAEMQRNLSERAFEGSIRQLAHTVGEKE